MRFDILPPSDILKDYVDCFSIFEYNGDEGLAISVSPKAVPGLVFHHHNGQSAIESIVTHSRITPVTPTLFVCGAGTEPSIMNFTKGPYTSIHVVLKPDALNSLFGLNASTLADGFLEPHEFSADDLNAQLLEAQDTQQRIALLAHFLVTQLKHERTRDRVIEESLKLIHHNIACISVKSLLEHLHISERHFERRFSQTVGISPQSYIRVQRFNEAIRLIKAGQYDKLTDIAYALNFYDQSHFVRDINAFSGISPKTVSRKDDDFYHGQVGYSYT
jgi:AraC-like DNA-binding protein